MLPSSFLGALLWTLEICPWSSGIIRVLWEDTLNCLSSPHTKSIESPHIHNHNIHPDDSQNYLCIRHCLTALPASLLSELHVVQRESYAAMNKGSQQAGIYPIMLKYFIWNYVCHFPDLAKEKLSNSNRALEAAIDKSSHLHPSFIIGNKMCQGLFEFSCDF